MNGSMETIFIASVIVLFLFVGALAVRQWRMEKRLRAFFEGKDAKSLEDVFALLRREVMAAHKSLQDLDARARSARETLRRSVQHVGIVRFNPFREAGSDQSFCIAMLDEQKNGVVISSLYSRDGVRVYGKPVQNGISSYTLSGEEQEAIQRAMQES
jgi:hypothetical protein